MNNPTDVSSQVPAWLLITFTVCTTLLVSVHMLALMISTCILPNVEQVAAMEGLVSASFVIIIVVDCLLISKYIVGISR